MDGGAKKAESPGFSLWLDRDRTARVEFNGDGTNEVLPVSYCPKCGQEGREHAYDCFPKYA